MRAPARSPSRASSIATRSGRLYGSRTSGPASVWSTSAASATERVMGPSATKGSVPAYAFGRMTTGTRPNEAFMPNVPHHAAGIRMEPPASVPSANGTSPSATAAALPPDEPPAFLVRSKGFLVGPKSGLSQVPRKPMTGLLVLPMTIAPSRSTRSTNTQRASMTVPASARTPPNVDGQPGLKSNRSFIAVGTPCSGPSSTPSITSRWARRARSRASSNPRWTNAPMSGSRCSMRSMVASMTSTGDSCRLRMRSASSVTDRYASSSGSVVTLAVGIPPR